MNNLLVIILIIVLLYLLGFQKKEHISYMDPTIAQIKQFNISPHIEIINKREL